MNLENHLYDKDSHSQVGISNKWLTQAIIDTKKTGLNIYLNSRGQLLFFSFTYFFCYQQEIKIL